ncbi:MAG: DUF423 domain-containing protein [Acetobacteraceae bacterium]|nr:DUF423 domain-containing protein [Acetobacteraceae bacterium]
MTRIALGAGACAGAAAVVLAVPPAHALPLRLDRALLVLVVVLEDSAPSRLRWQGVALVGTAALADRLPDRLRALVAFLLILGLVLFCGAVLRRATLALSPGPFAPLGGMALGGGWLVPFYAAFLAPR